MTIDRDASRTFSVSTLECCLKCSLQPVTLCMCLYSYYYWSSYQLINIFYLLIKENIKITGQLN